MFAQILWEFKLKLLNGFSLFWNRLFKLCMVNYIVTGVEASISILELELKLVFCF